MHNKRAIEIICEAGINHNGNIETAIQMIHAAADSGACTIKFQVYNPASRPDIDSHPFKEVLIDSRLTQRDLYTLKDVCDRIKINFLCSVFDVDKVQWLEEVGVERYKIGSKSLYDVELIEAIQKTNKPYIISLGLFSAEKEEREKYKVKILDESVMETWKRIKRERSEHLYCNFKYPTEIKDVYFDDSDFIGSEAGGFDGFSDHTTSIFPSIFAMSLGAKIIEKHCTMDKSAEGPDHKFSIDFDELALLCKARDEVEEILYG